MIADLQGRMASKPVFPLVVFSAIILWMVFGVIGSSIQARSQRHRYDDDRDESVDQDDDRSWFFGFYNNPDDVSLYVATGFLRRGLNLGNPVGLALMIVIIVAFAALDVFSIVATIS